MLRLWFGVRTSALNGKEGARGDETHSLLCHAYPFAPATRVSFPFAFHLRVTSAPVVHSRLPGGVTPLLHLGIGVSELGVVGRLTSERDGHVGAA
jgi:hypothetical protein